MHIAEIWRYPVKSMLGEPLEETNVGPGGIQGDRQWAVVDTESGVSLSAKCYPDLLHCRAWTRDGEVTVELPDGSKHAAGTARLGHGLSDLLGRRVTTRSAEATETIRHEFPTAVTEGTGDPFLWEPGTDSFFDSAPLHLLTTGTLAELKRLLPASKIDGRRFRPNFLIETADAGFIENDWVGKDVNLGALAFQVYEPMRRCVMVTREQGTLPRDIEVIRTLQENNDRNAGVSLRTQDSGTLRCGDSIQA